MTHATRQNKGDECSSPDRSVPTAPGSHRNLGLLSLLLRSSFLLRGLHGGFLSDFLRSAHGISCLLANSSLLSDSSLLTNWGHHDLLITRIEVDTRLLEHDITIDWCTGTFSRRRLASATGSFRMGFKQRIDPRSTAPETVEAERPCVSQLIADVALGCNNALTQSFICVQPLSTSTGQAGAHITPHVLNR